MNDLPTVSLNGRHGVRVQTFLVMLETGLGGWKEGGGKWGGRGVVEGGGGGMIWREVRTNFLDQRVNERQA